jgi:hypothetical protein
MTTPLGQNQSIDLNCSPSVTSPLTSTFHRSGHLHDQRHPRSGPTSHSQLHPADQVTGGRHAATTPPPRHRQLEPDRPWHPAPRGLLERWPLESRANPTTAAARPSLTAKLTILAPHNGQTLSHRTSEVRLGLTGAKIVSQTTTRIRPDQGHIHLLVDGKLVAMNYGLNERLPALAPASTSSRSSCRRRPRPLRPASTHPSRLHREAINPIPSPG